MNVVLDATINLRMCWLFVVTTELWACTTCFPAKKNHLKLFWCFMVWPLRLFMLCSRVRVSSLDGVLIYFCSWRNLFKLSHFSVATWTGTSAWIERSSAQCCSRKFGSCFKVSKSIICMQLINHLILNSLKLSRVLGTLLCAPKHVWLRF